MKNFIFLGLVVLVAGEASHLLALLHELVVGLDVHGEVALAAEQLVADAALVGGLLVRGGEVEEEVVLRGKLHPACLALELSVLVPWQQQSQFNGKKMA